MTRKMSRRNFLEIGIAGLGLASLGPPALVALAKEAPPQEVRRRVQNRPRKHDTDWAFVVDINKCIGCGRCVLACKLENRVPLDPDLNRTWVERYAVDGEGEVYSDSPRAGVNSFPSAIEMKRKDAQIEESFFVPRLCNQCDNAPCVQVCPVNASYRTADGVVLIDQSRCIGCRYCIVACPYGARYFLPDVPVTPSGQTRVADKCTWCYHRITKGYKPACVEVCPAGARLFGNPNDENDPVSKIIEANEVHVLKPEQGTKPKVYYLGLQDWL